MAATIRDARPQEFSVAGDLTAIAYQPILAFGAEDPYLDELRDATSRAELAQLLVYESDAGEVLGTVTVARPDSEYAEIAQSHELEVRMMAVAPHAHGRGIGRQLMGYVHNLAREESYTAIALSVIGTNVGALRFYSTLGYRAEPSRDWYPVPGMPAPLKVLTKDLSD